MSNSEGERASDDSQSRSKGHRRLTSDAKSDKSSSTNDTDADSEMEDASLTVAGAAAILARMHNPDAQLVHRTMPSVSPFAPELTAAHALVALAESQTTQNQAPQANAAASVEQDTANSGDASNLVSSDSSENMKTDSVGDSDRLARDSSSDSKTP